MALRGDEMGYHARHEARCHGPHLRCFPDSHDLRGPLHRDALVSWKDKPIMPNVFTYFLLPGYNLAAAIPLPSPFRLGMAITFDCILFCIPVWLVLQFRYWQRAESD